MNKPELNKYNPIKGILTIAGFDGTGGAGISADIKVSSFLKIQNCSVIACLVIQSPFNVIRKVDIKLEIIKKQILVLKEFYDFHIINIGLLGDFKILKFVHSVFKQSKIILDPIYASGNGKFQFVNKEKMKILKSFLRNVFLLTPNIPEAEILSGYKIVTLQDVKEAAIILRKMGAQNILIKGGHFDSETCYDTLFYQDRFFTFSSPKKQFRIHGTGSFLNAAISGYLFLGEKLNNSIDKSIILVNRVIKKTVRKNPILTI